MFITTAYDGGPWFHNHRQQWGRQHHNALYILVSPRPHNTQHLASVINTQVSVIYTPLTKTKQNKTKQKTTKLASPESAQGRHTQGTTCVTDDLNDAQAPSHTKLLYGFKIKVHLYWGTLSCYNNLYRTHKLCYLNDSEISLWCWH